MLLKNIAIAAAIIATLSACGSSGGGIKPTPDTATNNTTHHQADGEVTAEKTVDKNFNLSALKEQESKDLADDFSQYGFKGIDNYEITIGGKTYRGGNIDLNTLGQGLQRLPAATKITATANGQHYAITTHDTLHLYQQNYSIILGGQLHGGTVSGGSGAYRINANLPSDNLEIDTVKGQDTQTLPTVGTFRYSGVAFSQNEQGKLDYSVDFDKRTGSGSISGITEAGNITLKEGRINTISHTNPDNSVIKGHGIESTATSEKLGNGNYHLGFFGPNAEEIAGVVVSNEYGNVGFGRAKQ